MLRRTLAFLMLVACSQDGPAGGSLAGDPVRPGDATAGDNAGGDPTGSGRARFEIDVVEIPKSAAYAGVANPPPGWHYEMPGVEALRIGDCAVIDPRMPDPCDPACTTPEVCFDGRCLVHGTRPSAGVVTVTGLASALTLTPMPPQIYYQYEFAPEPIAGEIFSAGDPIEASAPGETIGGFTVQTLGVADLDLDLACPPGLQTGQSLTVTWTPSGQGDSIEILFSSPNHADQFTRLACATTDSGRLTVDATLVTRYLTAWRPLQGWRARRLHTGRVSTADAHVTLTAHSAVSCVY